jgi:hypothetical protein
LWAVAFLLLALIACQGKKEKQANHYSIDSLLTAQVTLLSSSKAVLVKQAAINGSKDSSRYTPTNSMAWATELAVFYEANAINKPLYRNEYEVSESKDPNSNLLVRQFTAKKELPISELKIYYLETPARVKKIEAWYHEQNSLYATARKLVLNFQDYNNKPRLISYSISGDQKMIADDSTAISISGTIVYQN